MGKFASFVSGAGQGALATKRYQDSLSRAKKQDELLAAVLTGNMKKDGLSGDSDKISDFVSPMFTVVPPRTLTDEDIDRRRKEPGYSIYMANGGMVQPMPQHWDKMSWQRVSFKK